MRWLLFILAVYADLALAQSSVVAPVGPVSNTYLLKLGGGLLLVVALIFAIAWIVRKFNLNPQQKNGLIQVIAGLPLGTRDRLLLVQVGEEQILLGLTQGQISKLHHLQCPVEVTDKPAAEKSFASRLSQIIAQKGS
jgi:flagellar protein FliO/FliZ